MAFTGTMAPMGTVLFVGGGTLGHVVPGVSVARALTAMVPDVSVFFVCSPRGEDSAFLTKERMSHVALNAPRISPSFLWNFPLALRRAGKILDAIRPDVVFSKGGYVSVPVCLAARRRNIPIVLHESDATMGRANRLIASWADTVCTGFPTAHCSLLTAHCSFSGNPVREEIRRGDPARGRALAGFSNDAPVLLVLGGSQGSRAINDAVHRHLPALLGMCNVIHLTGAGKRLDAARPGYAPMEFAHDALPHLLAAAALAVSRAGAGTIAELAAAGVPAILVPLAGVARDHQVINARRAAESGGAVVCDQQSLDRELEDMVRRLIGDPGRLAGMKKAILGYDKPDAAGQIAAILSGCLARRARHP